MSVSYAFVKCCCQQINLRQFLFKYILKINVSRYKVDEVSMPLFRLRCNCLFFQECLIIDYSFSVQNRISTFTKS